MSTREKRLQKLRQNRKNVSMQELAQVLQDHGFELDRSPDGSHHHFEYNKNGLVIALIIPFRRRVKEYYVKQVLKAIDLVKEHTGE